MPRKRAATGPTYLVSKMDEGADKKLPPKAVGVAIGHDDAQGFSMHFDEPVQGHLVARTLDISLVMPKVRKTKARAGGRGRSEPDDRQES